MPPPSLLIQRLDRDTGEDVLEIDPRPAFANRVPCEVGDLERVAYRLSPIEGDAPSTGTGFGGRPWMAPGAAWPHNDLGPLGFVGQLDFADFTDARHDESGLPREGVLALFVDYDAVLDIQDPTNWHIAWVPEARELLEPPLGLEWPAQPMRPVSRHSYPVEADLCFEGMRASDVAKVLARRNQAGRQGTGVPSHQVGGFADWMQFDERLPLALREAGLDLEVDIIAEAESRGTNVAGIALSSLDWVLLWQIDSDPVSGFDWVDAGKLYVLIRGDDLAAGRLERARVAVSFDGGRQPD